MRLYHPLGFMLASPAETAEEAFESFAEAVVEDKYDGIRAQAHCGGDAEDRKVRLFSRTLDDVTGSFPELVRALEAIAEPAILDGEIVAFRAGAGEGEGDGEGQGRALPFAELQKRLGRKAVTREVMLAVPVAFVAFDVLYARGALQLDTPLREREAILDAIFAARSPLAPRAPLARAPKATARGQLLLAIDTGAPPLEPDPVGALVRSKVRRAASVEDLEALFVEARARGNEGLMIKEPASVYTPGRRGRAWLKLKKELSTLDVVVTAVEYGHGKRAGVLSDYTFSVKGGDRLLTIGKAYSGLTDKEIADLTAYFLEHTIEDQGYRRVVEPTVVIEVAFNNMMESDRHESGYALRFPRILRVRTDKSPADIDTLDAARAIFERQAREGAA
jgi:DNA ligase-1